MKEELKRYYFVVEDEDEVEIYKSPVKPTLEMMLEEVGRFERHFKGKEKNEE